LEQGFESAKIELDHHVSKMRQIRSLYPTRTIILAHLYIYLRDGASSGWRSLRLHEVKIAALAKTMGVRSPPSPSGSTPPPGDGGEAGFQGCDWCGVAVLHPGGKSQCPFNDRGKKEARRAGRDAVRKMFKNTSTRAPYTAGRDGGEEKDKEEEKGKDKGKK